MITHHLKVSKKKVDFFADNLGSGNVVPNHWYHSLLRPCGKSDTTAIAILSELVFLHRYNNQSEFPLNYNYFKSKFNFGFNQAKDAVIRLEQAGLIKRDFRTVLVLGRSFTNELYLILNIANVLGLNQQIAAKKFADSDGNCPSGSIEIPTDNIETRYLNKKSRSIESNFNQSDFKVGLSKNDANDSLSSSDHSYSNNSSPVQLDLISPSPSQSLSAFHPLNKDDVEWLQIRSGRGFDMNFINQLLLKVGDKYPDKKFYSKPSVLNYMSKVLFGEMRDAVKVSNGCFKFIRNTKHESLLSQTATNITLNPELSPASAPDLSPVDDLCSQKANDIVLPHDVGNGSTRDDSVWGRVRQGLVNYFRNGEGLDISWFSKLTPTYDEYNKRLTLIAPSNFMRDWIKNNYECVIEQLCAREDYQLTGVYV